MVGPKRHGEAGTRKRGAGRTPPWSWVRISSSKTKHQATSTRAALAIGAFSVQCPQPGRSGAGPAAQGLAATFADAGSVPLCNRLAAAIAACQSALAACHAASPSPPKVLYAREAGSPLPVRCPGSCIDGASSPGRATACGSKFASARATGVHSSVRRSGGSFPRLKTGRRTTRTNKAIAQIASITSKTLDAARRCCGSDDRMLARAANDSRPVATPTSSSLTTTSNVALGASVKPSGSILGGRRLLRREFRCTAERHRELAARLRSPRARAAPSVSSARSSLLPKEKVTTNISSLHTCSP